MLSVILLLALGQCAATVERFKEKGIQYEEFGRARLLLERGRCKLRRFAMSTYINSVAENEDSDVDGLILKTAMRTTFVNVCRSHNISTGVPAATDEVIAAEKLRPLQKWVEEDTEVAEFAAAAAAFPRQCNVAEMTIDMLMCENFDEATAQGTLYAVAHAGQFMRENDAFVFYDVPEYVVAIDDQDEIVPVEFLSCYVVVRNGSSFVCMERTRSECDITTMESCDIFAISTANDFQFIRHYGTGVIVATNKHEVNITGTMMEAPTPIFTLHTTFEIENDGDEQSLVTYAKKSPVENEVSFPGMSAAARDAVQTSKEAIRMYRITRKGIPILSVQPGKASVWDDFMGFFLHLV
ncbi:unnamed protein product [Nippostrongylus brasiliensis]|uniref:C-CAP/cofactor C-like domain-containing protein n=1 Tax=Nippostrongylus brasiliensis TaxID=27835 RepID=A0A0N4Y8X3_NIPBR|nr:unnamed protein product [Nippostrongylus brasiliensis]